MTKRVFTKPVICISIDARGAAVVLGRAESVPNAHVLSDIVQQKIVAAIESRYPMIEAYVQHIANVPTVQMSTTARKLCGASDSDIESIVDDCIRG